MLSVGFAALSAGLMVVSAGLTPVSAEMRRFTRDPLFRGRIARETAHLAAGAAAGRDRLAIAG